MYHKLAHARAPLLRVLCNCVCVCLSVCLHACVNACRWVGRSVGLTVGSCVHVCTRMHVRVSVSLSTSSNFLCLHMSVPLRTSPLSAEPRGLSNGRSLCDLRVHGRGPEQHQPRPGTWGDQAKREIYTCLPVYTYVCKVGVE